MFIAYNFAFEIGLPRKFSVKKKIPANKDKVLMALISGDERNSSREDANRGCVMENMVRMTHSNVF